MMPYTFYAIDHMRLAILLKLDLLIEKHKSYTFLLKEIVLTQSFPTNNVAIIWLKISILLHITHMLEILKRIVYYLILVRQLLFQTMECILP